MKQYPPFRFKQFTVEHNLAAMKVGTDGILLGAWASAHENEHILDVGTGTGLISLMLAQKVDGKCHIDAIEIDQNAVQDATVNFNNSPWSSSFRLYKLDFNDYESNSHYDVIISNPPFYEGKHSTNIERNIARNARGSLSFDILLEKSAQLLTWEGRLFLIVPFEIADRIISNAKQFKLYCKERINVRSRPDLSFSRSLLEFRKTGNEVALVINELCIQAPNSNSYTIEFRKLSKDFYL